MSNYVFMKLKINRWFKDCCEFSANESSSSSYLYESFRKWCERNNQCPFSNKLFGVCLEEMGIQKKKSNGSKFIGIKLIQETGIVGMIEKSLADDEKTLPNFPAFEQTRAYTC